MCLTPQNLSFTLLYIVTTSWHIRAHHKPAPRLQLTEIFFMESDNGSTYCKLYWPEYSGQWHLFRSEAVGDNGVTKRFYHRLTPVPANVTTARKMHSTGFGSGIAVPHGKAPALNNHSCCSHVKHKPLTGKPAMAKTSIAGSASAYRKAAKRIRSKSSAHCVAKLSIRILSTNCDKATPTGCLLC